MQHASSDSPMEIGLLDGVGDFGADNGIDVVDRPWFVLGVQDDQDVGRASGTL
jgi:hypothetical protein